MKRDWYHVYEGESESDIFGLQEIPPREDGQVPKKRRSRVRGNRDLAVDGVEYANLLGYFYTLRRRELVRAYAYMAWFDGAYRMGIYEDNELCCQSCRDIYDSKIVPFVDALVEIPPSEIPNYRDGEYNLTPDDMAMVDKLFPYLRKESYCLYILCFDEV